jgi:hypothetical protein
MHSTVMNAMRHQYGRRAATAKRDTTTARQNSTIALQNSKPRQVATTNTKAQPRAAENCSVGYFNDSLPADTTAENRLAAAECSKEVAFITYQIVAEARRALVATYDALMATTYLLVQSCKLTWAVGCLTMALGRYVYDTGKTWWKRLVG